MTLQNSSDLTRTALRHCQELARFTEHPGTITRTFLSPPMREVHAHLDAWAARMGLQTELDAVGNWHTVRRSDRPDARTLIIASHLDTVPNGGAYDGALGVVLGLALLEAFADTPLPYHLHVIGFSEEEGVRFGVSFIGSRAVMGSVEPLLDLTDPSGVTVRQAMTAYGLDAAAVSQAKMTDEVLGYLEVHIEQGPVLEAEGRALGPVSAIVGQARLNLTFTGTANHAGTTPMHLRRDALAGASEFVLATEALARQTPGLAATVGMLSPLPGASNVIPGEVHLTLDIRHASDEQREQATAQLLKDADRLAHTRSLTFTSEVRSQVPATPMDPELTGLLAEALVSEGHSDDALVSGAGHDAMVTGTVWPSTMLFVRSPGGVSHHPDETVIPEDVEAALRVGWRFLQRLADREQTR